MLVGPSGGAAWIHGYGSPTSSGPHPSELGSMATSLHIGGRPEYTSGWHFRICAFSGAFRVRGSTNAHGSAEFLGRGVGVLELEPPAGAPGGSVTKDPVLDPTSHCHSNLNPRRMAHHSHSAAAVFASFRCRAADSSSTKKSPFNQIGMAPGVGASVSWL